MKVYFV